MYPYHFSDKPHVQFNEEPPEDQFLTPIYTTKDSATLGKLNKVDEITPAEIILSQVAQTFLKFFPGQGSDVYYHSAK